MMSFRIAALVCPFPAVLMSIQESCTEDVVQWWGHGCKPCLAIVIEEHPHIHDPLPLRVASLLTTSATLHQWCSGDIGNCPPCLSSCALRNGFRELRRSQLPSRLSQTCHHDGEMVTH